MMRAIPLLALLTACTTAPQLHGTVVDIWGDPVEGAVVKMEGTSARPVTDANGTFNLPFLPGTHTLKAGREGYIQEDVEIAVPESAGDADRIVFRLYPIPEQNGFHVVGSDGYTRLEPKPIRALGNNLKSLYGIQHPGTASVDGSELRFVYHGDLRQDQLMSLDISLHRLDFVESAELQGIVSAEVDLNLYVSDGTVPLEIERLRSRNDYLIKTTGPVENGRIYALTTNHLLEPIDDESFRRIAPALRLAFPVELR